MDFTIQVYKALLNFFQGQDCNFQSFGEYQEIPTSNTIIFRHDADKLPQNALRFAETEHDLGIRGTYYFRIVPRSFDEKVIEEIASLWHKIIFYYETSSRFNKINSII